MKDVNILTNNGVNVQQSLELLGDMEMYDETLSDFLDLVDEKISNLEKYKAANDMPNYAIEVHALKSDARYLGFLTLGDLAYDSEMKSKAGDVSGVELNHPKILVEVNNMINIANKYLGRVAAPSAQPAAVAQAMPAQAQPQAVQVQQPVQAQGVQMVQPMQSQVVIGQPMQAQGVQPQVMMGQPMQAQPMPMQGQIQVQAQPQAVQVQQPVQAQGVQPQVMMGQPMQAQPMPMQGQIQMQAQGVQMAQPMQQAPASMPQGSVVQPQGVMQPPSLTQMNQNVQQPVAQEAVPNDPMSQVLYQQQQKEAHQMPASLAPKEGTILVVDDSNLVANFVKKIFSVKYDVVIASDGSKAIELCYNQEFRSKIKACLLDLNMPKVDGFAVLEHFKQNGYFVKMPVAVVSGVEDLESIDKANSYPIVDILAKPFNERDVQRVVEKCLATYF